RLAPAASTPAIATSTNSAQRPARFVTALCLSIVVTSSQRPSLHQSPICQGNDNISQINKLQVLRRLKPQTKLADDHPELL
ncbi:MAG: hypothetical protein ACRER9_00940, partial [Gammaproteobacteria bacterium]